MPDTAQSITIVLFTGLAYLVLIGLLVFVYERLYKWSLKRKASR